MKKTSIFLAALLVFGLGCIEVNVKYSQLFAEKKITITEQFTVLEQFTLPFKKGFVNFEL
jgi:hypothetical protein